jgi:hypothetical protein
LRALLLRDTRCGSNMKIDSYLHEEYGGGRVRRVAGWF